MRDEVLVGWRCTSPQAALAFFPPEPIGAARAAELGVSPDMAERILQIRCPYDLTVRLVDPNGTPPGFQQVPMPGGLSQAGYKGLATPILRRAQRDQATPALQISMNLMMVTEEACALHLTPPFLEPGFRQWPGTLVCGRFPLRSWPRPLNAVLEWQDQKRPWVLRRGAPMAYIWLHFDDPNKVPKVVEAKLTPALKRHFAQVDNVSSFGRNVGPMFDQAQERRPARLLVAKETGCPDFAENENRNR